MSTQKKAVTNNQGMRVAKMAREKGVDRACLQAVLDDGTMARVLNAIRDGQLISISSSLIPPSSARIHTLPGVRYDKGRDWQEAISAGASNTRSFCDIHQVGDQYPPGEGAEEGEIILLNFPYGGNWRKAIAWAEQFVLELTDPRQVFAIGEHFPNLHRELGLNPMYVMATKECYFAGHFQACYVWWDNSGRGAGLHCLEQFCYANVWLAFRRRKPAQ